MNGQNTEGGRVADGTIWNRLTCKTMSTGTGNRPSLKKYSNRGGCETVKWCRFANDFEGGTEHKKIYSSEDRKNQLYFGEKKTKADAHKPNGKRADTGKGKYFRS